MKKRKQRKVAELDGKMDVLNITGMEHPRDHKYRDLPKGAKIVDPMTAGELYKLARPA